MAQESPVALPGPDMVGGSFIQQYYAVMCTAPDQLHRFYQDSSFLSRPGADGAMTSVTTMQGINELLLTLDLSNYGIEILTADFQSSYYNGVMVFVTGFLSGKDAIKRKFTQTFFLAPQNNAYVVLNDFFMYVDDHVSTIIAKYDHEPTVVADASTNEADLVDDAEIIQVIDQNHTALSEENINNGDEANHQLENAETSIPEKVVEIAVSETSIPEEVVEIAVPQQNSVPNDVVQVAEKTYPVVEQNAPKKSFASMVNALKENPAPFQSKVTPKPSTKPSRPTATAVAASPAPAPGSNNYAERSNGHTVKGHSVFIRNLPCDTTAEQLEAVFKKFGSIKPGGIQVRGFKDQQSCFGFVEFESSSSMDDAIKASPVAIGNRNASVEMKRRDSNDNFRPRGGFRNDNFRPRGGFGGRGYGRNEFENRGEYSGRGRGNIGRGGNSGRSSSNGNNGNSYPRECGVDQNGAAAPETAKV